MRDRQYLVSERAHLMCPNMHFGIKVKIKAVYNKVKFEKSLKQLEMAHSFLQSIIEEEQTTGKLFYAVHKEKHIAIIEKENSHNWQEDYKAITSSGWDVFKDNMLKILVYPSVAYTEFIFIAHHLLGDGRAILGLVNEFINCYVANQEIQRVEEQLLTCIEDLPPNSDLSFISKLVINGVNKKWQAENQKVTYAAYHDFEVDFIHRNEVEFKEESVEIDEVNDLLTKCRAEGISLNDYLVAEMMFKEKINKVVIAADIRKQLNCYHQGALGNYATAMGIICKTHSNDIMCQAKAVSKQIKKHLSNPQKSMLVLVCYFRMIPELIDAVAISTLGDFQSKAGKFVGTKMFGYETRNGYSITNLGNIRNSDIIEAMFIPPASPANKKTIGVLSVNGYMKKCTAEYKE